MLLDLNTKATGRIPLIVAWASAFALQAILRSTFHGTPLAAPLLPIYGPVPLFSPSLHLTELLKQFYHRQS